ncbi:hypothetical protein IF2G_10877 [Cordyceps javanica]|nr:hypothetical protein IF2G_10877 [Cordyceps javanica]
MQPRSGRCFGDISHIHCDEICVYCHFPAKTVSEFLSHYHQHEYVDGTAKSTYMSDRRRELRELVAADLAAAPARNNVKGAQTKANFDTDPAAAMATDKLVRYGNGRKRTQAEAGFNSESTSTQHGEMQEIVPIAPDDVGSAQVRLDTMQQPAIQQGPLIDPTVPLNMDDRSDRLHGLDYPPIWGIINYPYQVFPLDSLQNRTG